LWSMIDPRKVAVTVEEPWNGLDQNSDEVDHDDAKRDGC
jgi:hypothetical protein